MAYISADARQQLLDSIAEAADHVGVALTDLGAAYDGLDEVAADRLEEVLFRPVQAAFGRAKRTCTEFAERYGLRPPAFVTAPTPSTARRPRELIDAAVDAARHADDLLSTLQDSMMPVEVGDPELRAGLAEVREHLGHTTARARELERTLGR